MLFISKPVSVYTETLEKSVETKEDVYIMFVNTEKAHVKKAMLRTVSDYVQW